MPENSIKQASKRKKPEEIVQVLAHKYDVTTRFVQMVISGDRTHPEIFADYMTYTEENNQLLQAVKELCPFNS